MNPLLDNTDEDDRVRRSGSSSEPDREITLGTTMILLIFFALAVYGAALFGFGYSMGSKRSGVTAIAAAPIVTPSSSASKPAPGSPGKISTKAAPPGDESVVPDPHPAAARIVTLPVDSAESDRPAPSPVARPPLASSAPVSSATTPAATPTLVVQVAAVSHKEDADLIASTLQRRGYAVNINNEADKLLHIQVGPFSNRKDAEAMRARLLADGFNAYIK